MPRDEHGAPLKSFYREDGAHVLTYEEKLKYDEDIKRINEGGGKGGGEAGLTDEEWANLRR